MALACVGIYAQHGTADRPIVYDLRGMSFNGDKRFTPLHFNDASYIDIIGGNYFKSRNGCVWVEQNCHHIRLRECCAWDAKGDANTSDNYKQFDIHGPHCTLIDCAAWGSGTKCFEFSYGGDDCVVQRCYGRNDSAAWMVFAPAYNNKRCVVSDCIGVCDTLPATPSYFYGVFCADRMDSGDPVNTLVQRCAAFSVHVVKAFNPQAVKQLVFDDCVDATKGKLPDVQRARELHAVWSASPILDRLKDLAGADPLADLRAITT